MLTHKVSSGNAVANVVELGVLHNESSDRVTPSAWQLRGAFFSGVHFLEFLLEIMCSLAKKRPFHKIWVTGFCSCAKKYLIDMRVGFYKMKYNKLLLFECNKIFITLPITWKKKVGNSLIV